MKDAPVNATLELWSLGHSARQIAEMLGYPNFRHVARIVAHAREIEDPRAVLHTDANGRPHGRAGHGFKKKHSRKAPKNTVQSVPFKLTCDNGHANIPENRMPNRQCRLCLEAKGKR